MTYNHDKVPIQQHITNALYLFIGYIISSAVSLGAIRADNYYIGTSLSLLRRFLHIGVVNLFYCTLTTKIAKFSYLWEVYLHRGRFMVLLGVVLVKYLFSMLLSMMMTYFPLNSPVGLFVFFFIAAYSILFAAAEYLFVSNPGYEIADYYRMSVSLMRPVFWKFQFRLILTYLGVAILIALPVTFLLVILFLGGSDSGYAIFVVLTCCMALLNTVIEYVIARFITKIIPYSWHSYVNY